VRGRFNYQGYPYPPSNPSRTTVLHPSWLGLRPLYTGMVEDVAAKLLSVKLELEA
jgi:hypothetical protein